jgi:tight adherence protein B
LVVVVSPAVLGALLGGGLALGVLVAVAGWRGEFAPVQVRRSGGRVDRLTLRVSAATGGALIGALVTRWTVVIVALAVAGWCAPSAVGLRARRRRQAARTEAVASWAEMLRDLLTSSAGLQEAIGKTAKVAPEAIKVEVSALYMRSQRGDLAPALRRFADELADPVADTVVAALIIADTRSGADLGGTLAAVAGSTRDTVALQQRVAAARARIYRTSQLIAGIVGGFVALLVLTNRDYMAPFGTAAGQLVLLVVAALVGAAIWAMAALSRPPRAPRLLDLGSTGMSGGR